MNQSTKKRKIDASLQAYERIEVDDLKFRVRTTVYSTYDGSDSTRLKCNNHALFDDASKSIERKVVSLSFIPQKGDVINLVDKESRKIAPLGISIFGHCISTGTDIIIARISSVEILQVIDAIYKPDGDSFVSTISWDSSNDYSATSYYKIEKDENDKISVVFSRVDVHFNVDYLRTTIGIYRVNNENEKNMFC